MRKLSNMDVDTTIAALSGAINVGDTVKLIEPFDATYVGRLKPPPRKGSVGKVVEISTIGDRVGVVLHKTYKGGHNFAGKTFADPIGLRGAWIAISQLQVIKRAK